jgi:hypothetical protein
MPREVRWERMFPDELEAAFAACPVVYFAQGLCEPHGPQCAIGLDARGDIWPVAAGRIRYNPRAGGRPVRKGVAMFGDLAKMLKVAADMKRRMPEVQAKLEASEFVAEAGNGAVRATVNGKLRLRDIEIDRQALGDGDLDVEALGRLIRDAVSAAQEQAADAATQAMRQLAGGMSIPGMEDMI